MARGSARQGGLQPERGIEDRRDADPRVIVPALNSSGVDFVVIGGVAALSHGLSRITRDFDLVIEPSAANCARMIEVLVKLEAEEHLAKSTRWVAVDPKADPNWLLRQPRFFDSTGGAIDVCNKIPNVPAWEDADQGSREISAFGETFKVLDKDTLIRWKLAAGREKDLQDVAELSELDEPA